jgi:hypothetical protein
MKGCGHKNTAVAKTAATAAKTTPKPGGKPKKVWVEDGIKPPNWDNEDETPKPAPTPAVTPATPKSAAPVAVATAAAQVNTEKKEEPGRPADLAAWTADDYLHARQEGDRRLLDAIEYSERRDSTRSEAAATLAKLLDAPAAEADNKAGRKNGGVRNNAKIIEAVVAALFANDTPLARKTIAQLAAGEISTMSAADRGPAAAVVVKMLLARNDRWCEDALLAVATHPKDLSLNDAAMRKTTLSALKASAAESLRSRLAGLMTSPDMRKSLYDELWACLSEARPENLASQIALYRDRRMDTAARATLESRWLDDSNALWQKLLQNSADDKLGAAAEQLWSRPFAAAVEQRLAGIDSWTAASRDLEPLLLAATIPDGSLRASLFRILKRHWEDGPSALEAAGTAAAVVSEPGFVLLVKQLPRKDAPPGASAAQGSNTSASAPKTRAAEVQEARRLHDRLAQQWMQFSEKVVQSQFRRFAAAAAAADASVSPGEIVAGWSDVPRPPKSAEIVAAYRLENPAASEGKSGGPAMVAPPNLPRVWYWRAEQRGTPLRTLAYYGRQVPNGEERLRAASAWIDAFAAPAKAPVARSVDVFITRPSKAFSSLADQEQRLIVEVLVIECDVSTQK